jgi:hypothetical protein
VLAFLEQVVAVLLVTALQLQMEVMGVVVKELGTVAHLQQTLVMITLVAVVGVMGVVTVLLAVLV